jgi:predicted dehydrogenase
MSSSRDRFRVAVIGVGYLGRIHAEKYAELEEVELVAVVDIIPERAREIAEKCGTRAFTDYREILEKVDAVSIVVPTPAHYAVARDCLSANLDVLLEKPITETLAEADDLIALARERNRILQTGHLERFNPAIRALHETLVKPGFIEAHRLGSFQERASNVDVVLDLMIHDLDVVMSFVDAPVKSVSAMGVPILSDKVDIANARLEFENGCVGNFTASRVTIGEGMRKIRIFQPESYISIDYQRQHMAVFTLGPGDGRDPMSRIQVKEIELDRQDALGEEIRAFLQALRTREEPEASGIEARRALEVALWINRCIQQNLPRMIKDN